MLSPSFLGLHYTLFHIPSIYIICNQHKIIKRRWKSHTSSFRSTSVYSQPKNRSLYMATLLNIILIVTKLIFDVAANSAVFLRHFPPKKKLTLWLQGKNWELGHIKQIWTWRVLLVTITSFYIALEVLTILN